MKQKTIKQLKTELDKKFSLYIRQKNAVDGIVQCITCQKHYRWQDVDCGHFLSRRYLSIRWSEINTAPQCKNCNVFNQGRQYEMGQVLEKRYGKAEIELLLIKKNNVCKMDKFKYLMLIQNYTEKLKKIRTIK